MKTTKLMLMFAMMLTLAVTFAGCGDDSTSSVDTGTYFHIPLPDDSYFDRVELINVTITAADIDSPITATVPDSMISGESQVDIQMTVSAGDSRHYDLQAFDSDDQCLYRNQGDFDVSTSSRTDISIILRPIGSSTPNRVKLFRNIDPWSYASQPESILVSLGFSQGNGANQYQVFNSTQMGSVVLTPGIDLVILQANQDTTFYQDYVSASASFDEFAQDGGSMLFFYTASNFVDSIAGTTFPAGVEFTARYSPLNDVMVADHPITMGLEQELSGSFASHGYFSNLPSNSLILTAESDSLRPTMFIFNHGSGSIILSSQPVEFFRHWRSTYPTMGGILSRVIRFMLGYDPTPGEIPGPNLMPPGNSSSAISAREH